LCKSRCCGQKNFVTVERAGGGSKNLGRSMPAARAATTIQRPQFCDFKEILDYGRLSIHETLDKHTRKAEKR
jgi:hypothetical protein